MIVSRALFQFSLFALCILPLCGGELSRHQGWYGAIEARSGDVRFERIYVQDATLYHEGGREVALWGVNFQSAMSWEWGQSQRRFGAPRPPFNSEDWKAICDRAFNEIQRMGSEVIRIHLCPDDYVDKQGNLLETKWLDMLDYTMAECHRRGLYVNLALLNHLGGERTEGSSIINSRNKAHKWEVMVVAEKIQATETYIRQLVNRKNPYDADRPYKEYPGWIIAEIFNEPNWPTSIPSKDEFPAGFSVYEAWLADRGNEASSAAAWSAFKTESFVRYINRMDQLLLDERVPAITCWNLNWSRAPLHQGWESFDAAAQSTIPIVSFSTYPGQDDSMRISGGQRGAPIDLSDRNYLPYLKESYQRADWQGWLQQDRFKGRKASIVYEWETWHNQSTYLYPAMAKYFRAQGAQVATMWTYYLYDNTEQGLSRTRSHNLNLVTTPRKAASFLVAGQVFKHTPRYLPFETSEEDADRFGHAAFSLPLDLSAYADADILIHSGDLDPEFLDLPPVPKHISGYGSSPFVDYQGKGMYFIQAAFVDGVFDFRWDLEVMPNAEFAESGPAQVDIDQAFPMTLKLPGLDRVHWDVYRIENGSKTQVPIREPALTFMATPGRYEIVYD